jgi:thiamine biosynthesis protein ThiS
MKITVNGKTAKMNDGATLSALIAERKFDKVNVLVSVNKEIVKTENFSEVILAEGDEVELFCFVSGG